MGFFTGKYSMAEEAESCLRLKNGLKAVVNCAELALSIKSPGLTCFLVSVLGGLEVVGCRINPWVLPCASVSQPAQQCLGSCCFLPPLSWKYFEHEHFSVQSKY